MGVSADAPLTDCAYKQVAYDGAIVGLERPDFRIRRDFRKLHLEALSALFTQVLQLAHVAGWVPLGAWATDGSTFPGNASRHKALGYGYLPKEDERLQAAIAALLKEAHQQDEAEDAVLGSRRGDELPEELQFREQRPAKIQEAKTRLEAQARAAAERQQQQWQEEEAARLQEGKPPREPKGFDPTPDDQAQTNLTDPDWKIMPQPNKGWEYAGNAQVVVEDVCQSIVGGDVVPAANDKQQAVPLATHALAALAAAGIARPVTATGQVPKIVSLEDRGYFRDAAVAGLAALGFEA